MSRHLQQLMNVGRFACPPVPEVTPSYIGNNMESVEILTGGKLRFEMDGEEKIFTRGTVFWHMYGEHTICRTFSDDPYRCIVFYFKVKENKRPGPRVSIWSAPDEAVAFADECHKAFHSGCADLDALADYAYSMIRWKALTAQRNHPPDCPQSLLAAGAYIERNLEREISPEQIAVHAGISRPHLFALFRRFYGKAPLHFIQERRIARAKIMLTADNGASIKEIAMNCGFSELEVFYRQFKKQVGLTPAGYRRKYSVRPQETGGNHV